MPARTWSYHLGLLAALCSGHDGVSVEGFVCGRTASGLSVANPLHVQQRHKVCAATTEVGVAAHREKARCMHTSVMRNRHLTSWEQRYSRVLETSLDCCLYTLCHEEHER